MEMCALQSWKWTHEQYQWSWKTHVISMKILQTHSKETFSVAIFPNDKFSLLGKKQSRCWREFLRCYSVSQKKTGPTRQCSGHSVNALVQWRCNVKIMLLIDTEHWLTALTALVLWRNNYCLRTKMYILAHDYVSVDNFFLPNYYILFDIKFKELEPLC